MTSSFKRLRDFIQKQMRMSHIYQPVMIRELLKGRLRRRLGGSLGGRHGGAGQGGIHHP
jgi:hypothetical protein